MCMYARIADIYTFSFIFLFYFLFIKRKVSEEMPFSSEVFRIYSDNFRKNGYNFGRNSNNFGIYADKLRMNFARKSTKNTPKSACFLTCKISVFSLVAS